MRNSRRTLGEHLLRAAVICSVLPVLLARAQSEYVVDAWRTENGLPQNTVKYLLQTGDGYLWLGTFDGLARFDGVRFTVFTAANTPALRSSDISCLYEDSEGRLWIGTDGEGLHYLEKGEFLPASASELDRGMKVTGLARAPDRRMLVATTTGIFGVSSNTWEALAPHEWDASPTLNCYLAQNSSGTVCLTRGPRLYELEDNRFELRHTFSVTIGALAVEPDGTVLCALNDGRFATVRRDQPPHYRELFKTVFHSVRRTRNGDLWLAGQDGIFRQRGDRILQLTVRDGLTSNDAGCLVEDQEGNLWLGTNGGGLNRLREKLVHVYARDDGVPADDATSVIEDNEGRIWVSAFKGGVSVFAGGQWSPIDLPLDPTRRPDITALCQTRDGIIWIGGHYQPHYRWNQGRVESWTLSGMEALRVLFEDRDGGLWLGSRDAGVEYRRGEMSRRFDESHGLSRNMITAIAQDRSGAIWIGTAHGLNRISTNGIESFFRKDGLGANGVYALAMDGDDALWIGTAGGGLSRWRHGRFATVTQKEGLPSDIIGQLIEDDSGHFWMGTTVGIVRAAKKSLDAVLDGKARLIDCTWFGRSEGLLQSECNGGFQPSCLKARDGKLWFCTIGGMVVIDPKRIRHNPTPPKVHIEKLVMDDRAMIPRHAARAGAEPAVIPAGTARLEFHYTGLSLVAPSRVRFRYKLEGYDEDWIEAGAERAAHYTRVPPGDYQFRVTGANNDGVWNEEGAALPVVIKARFSESTWFRLLAFLVASGPIIGVVWLRSAHGRRVQALRLRIAHDLHDEAGSNLGSIQLLSRRAGKRLASIDAPVPELSEIQRISESTAESIRDVVWLIDPEFDTLEQMLKGMENVAARALGEISCEVSWRVGRTDRTLSIDFRKHFFLLFKEVLHNIQKHARATRVEIELSESNREFLLRIRDNGVGFDTASVTGGHGLNSLRQRARHLNGSVEIESRRGEGATVLVRARDA